MSTKTDQASLKCFIAELWRAKHACRAPWVSKSTHPRKFGNHVTVHHPPAARPSAKQGNQFSVPHFLASLGTGSPSSKYEHRRASALLGNIQNIRICMVGDSLLLPLTQ